MSIRVLSKVMRDSDETFGRRLVLFALADAAHDDGICWPLQDEIAHKARLSKKHAAELLVDLARDGAIEIRKAQRGRRRVNVYRLVLDGLAEPDYDRLPFTLTEPFTTPEIPDSSTVDGSGSTGSTDPDLREISAVRPFIGPVKGPVRGKPSSTAVAAEAADGPPGLTRIEGRDLAFDVLAEECGVDLRGNRAREVGVALNGSARSGLGIRTLAWYELMAARPGGYTPEAWEAAAVDPPESWERHLAESVRERAAVYRSTMGGAKLTPLALAKWWTDLDRVPLDPASEMAREALADMEAGR
jgi:hypothetical protein